MPQLKLIVDMVARYRLTNGILTYTVLLPKIVVKRSLGCITSANDIG